ncbi:hypothetical protein GCM10011504_14900 [Siccirubricoccus deserti]|uniref:DUF2459 domain-containing protein n=1 Tax=Siccirubricoccus deserti TaxID=2013562 RepID=A0A9X0QWN5_9PROT|nr:DUF2459 domain-containing protein [Siccirubricoccus deserti]MBC4015275.1 DUF2459 domain-containing protein [Siccirubricoccus deserti]GGC37537.1 hypothetical protein GCM10011504_14900 [Siccirubricoccus deserti]
MAGALGGCAARLAGPGRPAEGGPRLHLVRRGWHTDLGLPAGVLDRRLAGLFPGAAWMVLGFGDRDYVLAESPGLGTSLAALWPSPGAILVTGLRVAPDAAFGAAASIPLRLPPGGMEGVAGFITASLAAAEPLRAGPYPGSLFLPASREYSAFYTCNTWTAEGLAAAGLPVVPAGILFAAQINALGEALRAAGYG